MPLRSLLLRIRWANVARAAAIPAALALVVAWPHIGPRAPEPPPSAVIEPARGPTTAVPALTAAPRPAGAPALPRPNGAGRLGRGAAGGSSTRRPAARGRRAAARGKRRSSAAKAGASTRPGSSAVRARTPVTPRAPGAGARPRAVTTAQSAAPAGATHAPAIPPTPSRAAGPPSRSQSQREFGPAASEFPRRP